MEENEISLELNSSLSTNPLFSCIITLYTIILLYFPPQLVFSPVPILTAILLLSLLRIGATQKTQITETKENIVIDEEDQSQITETKENIVIDEEEQEIDDVLQQVLTWVTTESGFDPDPGFEETFVEWDVRAPLEVIYEDEEEDPRPEDKDPDPTRLIRYPSLSLYYPETDSDSSSDGDFQGIGDWVSPENVSFRWEEEDREGLIEIALDGGNNKRDMGFHVEEENLIEIDISPVKNDEFSDEGLGSVNVD